MQLLSVADSLMNTDPQAALDTLQTIESTVAASLRGRDRADYTLLMTEARYKCWLSVALDTSVFNAAAYYRGRGPEDKLVRALMMQGAVMQERSKPEQALLAYKEAETVIGRSKNLEQLGLLHTRIGSLYQSSFVDSPSAVYRYREALDCFEKAGLPARVMSARLSLARLLMIDSSEKARPLLESAMSMAEEYDDRMCGLSALELMTYNYDPEEDGRSIVNIVMETFSKYGRTPMNSAEKRIYKNITVKAALGYAGFGELDSARLMLAAMPLEDRVDSMLYKELGAEIAERSGDWHAVLDHREEVWKIQRRIYEEGYEAQLAESEQRYDNAELRVRLYKKEKEILLTVLLLTAALAVFFLIIRLMIRLNRKQKIETIRLKRTLKSKSAELERTKSEKDREEASRKSLEISLRHQISSNKALMGYYNLNNNAMRRLINLFNVYKGNPKYFLTQAVIIAEDLIAQTGSYDNAYSLIETAYPGFLDKLFMEYSGLNEDEKYLIALTCLGYPNTTVSYLLNISETNLSTKRTRLAQKMSLGKSLVKYLNERLASYQAG